MLIVGSTYPTWMISVGTLKQIDEISEGETSLGVARNAPTFEFSVHMTSSSPILTTGPTQRREF